jgi:hypothetical protein
VAYHQGFFRPINPKKYRGNIKEIVYRSGWEAKVMMWLDSNPDIVEWSSEEVVIPYRHPFREPSARPARYFMDFWWKDKSGAETICEVKPWKQTQKPTRQGKKGKLLKEQQTFVINTKKWEAAEAYAKKRGMTFMILTEKSNFNGIHLQGRTVGRTSKRLRPK